jgi:PhzF family phenazine biosynthesis protein
MRQWTIDAFTTRPFFGNSACVVEPLDAWPDGAWMQRLAAENGAGATAFLTHASSGRFALRWFTPSTEVPLCGHGTLAAAHALVAEMGLATNRVAFDTASGPVGARVAGGEYELTLPRPPFRRIEVPPGLADALGAEPSEVWEAPYLVAIFDDPAVVPKLRPRSSALLTISRQLGGQGNVGVAALARPNSDFDVIDRFFAPGYGFREDPATGSLHAILTPLLAGRLGPVPIRFHQAYPGRGAELKGYLEADRVIVAGAAVTVAESRLRITPGKESS